jgi:hypothetical protein
VFLRGSLFETRERDALGRDALRMAKSIFASTLILNTDFVFTTYKPTDKNESIGVSCEPQETKIYCAVPLLP